MDVSYSTLSSVEQMHGKYVQAIERIRTSTVKLEWFVMKVFSEQEIQEYVTCLRYVAVVQQQKALVAVLEDLRRMLPIPRMHGCKVAYQYVDYMHKCRLETVSKAELDSCVLTFDNSMPSLITRIGIDNARMIVNRLLRIERRLSEGDEVIRIGVNEVQSFIQSIGSSAAGPDYDASVLVQGSGGVMRIDVARRNLQMLQRKLSLVVMLEVAIGVLGVILLWRMMRDAQWLFAFIFTCVCTTAILTLQAKAYNCKMELAEYE
jgi:hypothetical protein